MNFLTPGFEDSEEGANVPFDKLYEIAELVSKELEWTCKESAEADTYGQSCGIADEWSLSRLVGPYAGLGI